ncbi:MAG: alpha/beta hydrolase [Chloroflexota bacterium]
MTDPIPQPQDQFIDIGLNIHIRHWDGHKTPFVLVHGLSSNCRTWDGVAEQLAIAGHSVITVDQRGHGLSDKPDNGYDFVTVSTDLARLIEKLSLDKPIMIGQSWGGNVMLDFGARFPSLSAGLGFVDGGYIDFQADPENSWEKISVNLRPPQLTGMAFADIQQRIQAMHPDWSQSGLDGTLANFEILPDNTVRPWLHIDNHMQILRAMWEQRPPLLYPKVAAPVLICAALDTKNQGKMTSKQALVGAAKNGLQQAQVYWFEDADHDIHVQQPDALATQFLNALNDGIWAAQV